MDSYFGSYEAADMPLALLFNLVFHNNYLRTNYAAITFRQMRKQYSNQHKLGCTLPDAVWIKFVHTVSNRNNDSLNNTLLCPCS